MCETGFPPLLCNPVHNKTSRLCISSGIGKSLSRDDIIFLSSRKGAEKCLWNARCHCWHSGHLQAQHGPTGAPALFLGLEASVTTGGGGFVMLEMGVLEAIVGAFRVWSCWKHANSETKNVAFSDLTGY